MKPLFLCGTRAVMQRSPTDYRVVCATCGAGGSVKHETQTNAEKAAVRDSIRNCRTCGAH